MHWESKMNTEGWAEVCKVLQKSFSCRHWRKVNIQHVKKIPVFRKLFSIINGKFTYPKDTLPLFLNQIHLCYYCNHKARCSAYIEVLGLCFTVIWKMQSVSLQGRPTLHNVVNAKNSEGTGPEKWRKYYFIVQTANRELLAAGQEIISKISPWSWRLPHRSSSFLLMLVELEDCNSSCACPVGQGTKGLSKMIMDVAADTAYVVNSTIFLTSRLKNSQPFSVWPR